MSNDFIPFAVGGSANVITQSAYAALTSVTQNGFQAGIAQSNQLNKVWRQSSIMAAVLAQFIVDQSGQNAVDDGTTATLEANLLAAIRNATKQAVILADTGAANAYAAANTPPLTALPSTGYVQRVSIAHANTGASTYAPDGLTAKPIYGLGLQPLQGGELPVGIAILMYLVQAGVNGGNGAWIIIESLGGASQVASATQTQHAVQLGQVTNTSSPLALATLPAALANQAVNLSQFANSLAASGYQKLPNGLIIQWGILVSGAGGLVQAVFPIAFPTACVSAVVNYQESGNTLGGAAQVSSNTTRTIIQANCFNTTNASAIVGGNIFYIAIGY